MLKHKRYCIADHLVDVAIEAQSELWAAMVRQYEPFEIEASDEQKPLFSIEICPTISLDGFDKSLVVNEDDPEFPHMELLVSPDKDKVYLFNIIEHASKQSYCRVRIDAAENKVQLALRGSRELQFGGFNLAFNLAYMILTATEQTLLLHASTVVTANKSYIFLGKSGTGKSTHSRMWLSVLGDKAELMNDDHPVVRVKGGEIIAYGSPWSGQTPCYKNMSAQLAAIVRIAQAPENKIFKLSKLNSYASLTTSCSGLSWIKELADGKDKTLQKIIALTDCYRLECLPNEAAAELAMDTLEVEYKTI